MIDDPYVNLANAIVAAAAKDYMKALKTLKKYPKNEDAQHEKRELERFFNSAWYKLLTDINSEYLLTELRLAVCA